MAKEFSDVINERTRARRVSANITQATGGSGTQPEADEAEKETRAKNGRTQGRKGCKLPRINMAFTPENYEFIQHVSHYKMMNLTKFVNYIIDRYREEHAEAYERAKGTAEEL